MEYVTLTRELQALVAETYALWDAGWVGFNWRAYTLDHVLRVRDLALTIGARQGSVDLRALELAALLHDITKPYDGEYVTGPDGKRLVNEQGYWISAPRPPARQNTVTRLYAALGLEGMLHNASGARLATSLLRERGVDEATCATVARTISQHLVPPEDAPIESQCLYDADCIDANIGLPAFVRNIYINMHYMPRRHPELADLDRILAEEPRSVLAPYVSENLPNWSAGKRRDFIPRLHTAQAREMALARLDRLDHAINAMGQEAQSGRNGVELGHLRVVLHYMQHRDDPSITSETAAILDPLRTDAPYDTVAHAFAEAIRAEIEGRA